MAPGTQAASEILRRLKSGEPAAKVATSLDRSGKDYVEALATLGLGNADDLGPTLIQQSPRYPELREALSAEVLGRFVQERSRALTLAAGLLQIHDFWDASHDAAQQAEDLGERDFSAYWHGIAHRREPDAGNASYWFRRVGRHPLFPGLAQEAKPILDQLGDASLSSRLIGGGTWNPAAMIDLCCGSNRETRIAELARRLQRLEMKLLIEATATAAGL
jgi:hypothetical protein